jgi:hypothetical protein
LPGKGARGAPCRRRKLDAADWWELEGTPLLEAREELQSAGGKLVTVDLERRNRSERLPAVGTIGNGSSADSGA